MKNYKRYLLLLLIPVVFCGCPGSKKDLYQQVFLVSDTTGLYIYKSYVPYLQDSLLPAGFVYNVVDSVSEKKFEVYNSFPIRQQLKEYIAGTPQKTIYFFLFDLAVIKNQPWDTIRARHLYLKRFSIRESEVNNTDDVILHYP